MFVLLIIHKLLQKQCYIKGKSLYKYTEYINHTIYVRCNAIGNPFSTHHSTITARNAHYCSYMHRSSYKLTSISVRQFRNDGSILVCGSACTYCITIMVTIKTGRVGNAFNMCSYLRYTIYYTQICKLTLIIRSEFNLKHMRLRISIHR